MGQPHPSSATVTALLLTGGASRRMGQAKATLMIDGERLAERTARLLAGVAELVIEVGPGYTSLPRAREDPPGTGPLAALAAGAAALGAAGYRDRALVVATDLPKLTPELLLFLARYPFSGCVVPLDADGQPQPTCARYSAAALARAPTLLAAGHRSLMALLDQVPVRWLAPVVWGGPAGRADALADLDTPGDLAALGADAEPPEASPRRPEVAR